MKIVADQQILAKCNLDSFLAWNILSFENFKLCRLKNYLSDAVSMESYNETLLFKLRPNLPKAEEISDYLSDKSLPDDFIKRTLLSDCKVR